MVEMDKSLECMWSCSQEISPTHENLQIYGAFATFIGLYLEKRHK